MEAMKLQAGTLSFEQIRHWLNHKNPISLTDGDIENIQEAVSTVRTLVEEGETIYGVNTGFGQLASKRIEPNRLEQLQYNLLVSHATGIGDNFSDPLVALIMLLKINSLAQGHSGVRVEVIEALISFLNEGYYPAIPSKGSVGASGDLAPLAHMSCALIGLGDMHHEGQRIPASKAIEQLAINVLPLQPKEGLTLLNGTQVSTALAVSALLELETLLDASLSIAAMSIEAYKGSKVPFDPRLHEIRRLSSQKAIAHHMWTLLQDSPIQDSHVECDKVQDPYSFRCIPQVLGACLALIEHAKAMLECEINAVTDNPLVFSNEREVLSGGNFHAQPVAFAADTMAMAIAEIGSLSERRVAILIDSGMSDLPAFLVEDSGENSGMMIAQVTSAALVSENKQLCVPSSVDSIPTSANQEDHVSMATYAARRLHDMVENLTHILAIELLCAAQGMDFHKPLSSSKAIQKVHDDFRRLVLHLDKDRLMTEDIHQAKSFIQSYSWYSLRTS